MAPPERLPVSLLTGFLGSGKTTLLNRLLRARPLTAVVINEFGEVGIDHQLVAGGQGPVALLAGGCVCCQVQGALAPTLKNLWMARASGRVPAYERLIIETSGVADPAPILETLARERWVAARHRLDAVLTTVDAQFGLGQLARHFEAKRQAAVADRLLITKTDLAPPALVQALRQRLEALNPTAPVYAVVRGAIEPDALLDRHAFAPRGADHALPRWLTDGRYRAVRVDVGLAGADAQVAQGQGRIRTFSLRIDTPLDWAGLEAALHSLVARRPQQLLRMKAIVNLRGRDRPVVLHAVQHVRYPPVELEAWPDADRASRFVFVAADLGEAEVAGWLRAVTQAAAGVALGATTR